MILLYFNNVKSIKVSPISSLNFFPFPFYMMHVSISITPMWSIVSQLAHLLKMIPQLSLYKGVGSFKELLEIFTYLHTWIE